ncbi:hypothetical protein FUSO4_09515 [Fusobacterium necrophorum DJ-1]|uniref:Uncharacterized protein n=2 Tax=Fusobacterium necrophorum TaxID=859 RepID=A0AB73BY87_9FUSO|nr:hypothetical protein [Fusobacterium necrophorum]KDE63350.1 hypothetical protein FUSO4_09515 [Fusobacterium necrophorum DJ-1]KDE64878.1 hypothetical protein FUSO3_02020 [Fusobacterium necrophorum BL]KDE71427.1 hypothetical protein FUSO8_07990 [Fusobacterium necrophorum DJ-2]KDE71709.1 hypothetical protein FUSO7_09695 [Fusobacterium necrophorum BFTR-2]
MVQKQYITKRQTFNFMGKRANRSLLEYGTFQN